MEQRYNYTDWDDSVYGTGRTEPPKHRSGLLAMMLILIIFLCGIITVLGILNVRLFQQLQNQDPAELAISFRDVETQPQETAAVEPSLRSPRPVRLPPSICKAPLPVWKMFPPKADFLCRKSMSATSKAWYPSTPFSPAAVPPAPA